MSSRVDYCNGLKLIHAFLSSRVDYCNRFLTDLSKKTVKQLQLVQKAAARVLMKMKITDHMVPTLLTHTKSLH